MRVLWAVPLELVDNDDGESVYLLMQEYMGPNELHLQTLNVPGDMFAIAVSVIFERSW